MLFTHLSGNENSDTNQIRYNFTNVLLLVSLLIFFIDLLQKISQVLIFLIASAGHHERVAFLVAKPVARLLVELCHLVHHVAFLVFLPRIVCGLDLFSF